MSLEAPNLAQEGPSLLVFKFFWGVIQRIAASKALLWHMGLATSVQVSVHAATERLASVLLSDANTNANVSTIVRTFPKVATAFTTQRSLDTARGMLKSGNASGRNLEETQKRVDQL